MPTKLVATKHRRVHEIAAVHPVPAGSPNFSHLASCVEDAKRGGLDTDAGPAEPTHYHQLMGRLQTARAKFPPLYRETVIDPYIAALTKLGPENFTTILIKDPERQSTAGLMLDIAEAVLQKGEGYNERATDAFQQVASDLYDGFLSAEDRKAVEPPEHATTAPLVKWGNPDDGPYTWPIDATRTFDIEAGIVNLPPANARRGLLAWAALGHETGGHDILHAYAGLEDQLATAVNDALKKAGLAHGLPHYWADRIDETASDVLGILNMGPAAAVGIIGYFRGLNAAYDGTPTLRNDGPKSDPHPADIVRGYLGAAVVGALDFPGAATWARALVRETDKDVGTIALGGTKVARDDAKRSAEVVAATIVHSKMPTLETHALGDIQNWRSADEGVVALVRRALTRAEDLPADHQPRIYAAHVVAGAVLAAVAGEATVADLFDRMLVVLDKMHAHNPSWGPLFVRHPGNIVRAIAYQRVRRVA